MTPGVMWVHTEMVNIGDCFAYYFKDTAVVSSHSCGFGQESLSSSPVISLRDTFPTLAYFKFLFVCLFLSLVLSNLMICLGVVFSVFLVRGALELLTSVGF